MTNEQLNSISTKEETVEQFKNLLDTYAEQFPSSPFAAEKNERNAELVEQLETCRDILHDKFDMDNEEIDGYEYDAVFRKEDERKQAFAEGILDISSDILMNEESRTMTVFPEVSDKALESIVRETGLLEKAGMTSLEETFGTDIEFIIAAEISENKEVTAEITMKTDTEEITVPIEADSKTAQEIADAVIETTEQHLQNCDSSIQKEFDEMEKESFQKGE